MSGAYWRIDMWADLKIGLIEGVRLKGQELLPSDPGDTDLLKIVHDCWFDEKFDLTTTDFIEMLRGKRPWDYRMRAWKGICDTESFLQTKKRHTPKETTFAVIPITYARQYCNGEFGKPDGTVCKIIANTWESISRHKTHILKYSMDHEGYSIVCSVCNREYILLSVHRDTEGGAYVLNLAKTEYCPRCGAKLK